MEHSVQTSGAIAEEQFRLAFELAPIGMLILDDRGAIVLANRRMETLFGYSRLEFMGMPFELLLPVRLRGRHLPVSATLGKEDAWAIGENSGLLGLRKDGQEIAIEIGMNPLHASGNTYLLSSIVDVSAHKRSEEELRQRTADLTNTLKQRDVLLHEIHHRVKNNLQVISSLINMQARKLQAGETRNALNECKARVEAIALIHEKLYESHDVARIMFSDYAHTLSHNVLYAAGASGASVALKLDIEEVSLAVDKAIPCGLILNELLSNAFKHAFPQGRTGTLHVQLRRLDSKQLQLAVTDDGIGIADEHREGARKSLGLQLVATLTQQLAGKLQIESAGGTSVRLTFPLSG